MENATKALIIAASVLIAIVLIAVGIKILSSTSGVTEQVGTVSTTMEVAMFNAQFTKFEGKQRGSAVRELIRLVQQTKARNTGEENIYIHVGILGDQLDTKNSWPEEFERAIKDINVAGTYNVTVLTDPNTGYVCEIEID